MSATLVIQRIGVLLLILALTGCAMGESATTGLGWVSRERTRPVTHLVLHHTAADLPTSLRILSGQDPRNRVSCHYLVTDEPAPRVIALVPEARVAFHAGESHWRGIDNLNEVSLGIEIVHPNGDTSAYAEAQVAAVARLVRELSQRHGIPPGNVLAHSDIAPGRKVDPGRFFPWERLHREHGLGAWPDAARTASFRDAAPPDARHLAALLRLLGYKVDAAAPGSVEAAVAAFQRHWRPDKVDGKADRETVARLRALLSPR